MPYSNPDQQRLAQYQYFLRNRKTNAERIRARRLERRSWFDTEILSKLSCERCGETHQGCLDFHHLDPEGKDAPVGEMLANLKSKESILAEISKCIVLCANCHRKEHYNQRRGVGQQLDRLPWKQEAAGASPASPTISPD